MKTVNDQIITGQALDADYESTAILLDQIYGFSMHLIYTGTPSGTLKLQCSNDPVQLVSQVANWSDISGTSTSVSGAGDTFLNVDKVYYRWVRVAYTFSSSTGSLTVNYFAKGV